jgi:pimeloyl-ACP methyl ester carboxylesterase
MRWLSALLVAFAIVAVVAALFTGTPAPWRPDTTVSRAVPNPGSRPWPPQFQSCAVPGVDGNARCGTVEVLESFDHPTGRRLAIRVIIVPAHSNQALPDPVVFLVGGPGQGAADLAGPLARRLAFLRDGRDLVFVDQRGTGESNGLTCPAPPRATDLMGHIFEPARLRACRDELTKRADLRRYTTTAAAADYEVIFEALGYSQVNVWGVSYGTRLGLELGRRLPGRVRTVTLDAVVPPSFTWPMSGARDAEAALATVISDCEHDPNCANSYPTFRRDVDAAFAAIATEPANATVFDAHTRKTERVPFATSDLAYSTRALLYDAQALQLPQLFRDAAAGNYDALAQAYVSRARNLGREIATGVHLGVYCAEDLPYVDVNRARAMAAGTRIATYLLDQYARACDIWPRGELAEGFREPIRSDVPTLMMTGQRDPVTPPWTAHEAAKTLTHARVLTWRFGGHGFDGLADGACKQRIIREFITTASVDQLSVECMSRDAR